MDEGILPVVLETVDADELDDNEDEEVDEDEDELEDDEDEEEEELEEEDDGLDARFSNTAALISTFPAWPTS